jgi:hypothetical protein
MTPEEYLAEQPADRRAALSTVRDVIRANLPNGYEECIRDGMLQYCVPLSRYPKAPKKKPLWYVALAPEKKYNSLHLMSVYGSREHEQKLRAAFASAGKKLDMGKACIHFRSADDLPLGTIGELVASIPVDRWIAMFEASRRKPSGRPDA